MRKKRDGMKNIPLKGAKNVRDLGGMQAGQKQIRPHMLLRSSHLNALTDRDINRLLNRHHLSTVIDLRTETEKNEKPNAVISGVHYEELPVFDGSLPGISHESKQNLDGIPDMRELYAYVMDSPCLNNLAAIVRRIVTAGEHEHAILYHCTEGKDRTGMVTALLLMLLGVSREDIMADYLYTNRINHRKAVYYFTLVRLFKRNKTAAGKVYNVFMAKEAYLNEVFKAVDRIGWDAFKADVLQLSDDAVKAFQNRMLIG